MTEDERQRDGRARAEQVALAHQGGSGSEWFDRFYAEARNGKTNIPWAKLAPNPNLTLWLDEQRVELPGKHALVVGCGLGDDAEELSRRGFDVTAVDVSTNALGMAQERFSGSVVSYQQADLLELPEGLRGGYDFVWEAYTLQSLPARSRAAARSAIASCLAVDGLLLLVAYARPEHSQPPEGPPYPLVPSEIQILAESGLRLESFEDYVDELRSNRPIPHYRALFRRPPDQG